MKTYKCFVLNNNGKKEKIVKSIESEEALYDFLSAAGFIPLSVKEITSNSRIASRNQNAVLEFTQIMEHLLDSGLSLKDAIEISVEINKKGKSKSSFISTEILSQINKGITFANAVESMDSIFPPVYRGIISVGDKIGSVETIFPRLRNYLETSKKIKEKIMGAIIYPLTVLTTAIIGTIGLAIFVFPRLKTMFQELGGDAANQLEKNISKLEISCLIILILSFCLIITAIFIANYKKRNKDFCTRIDRFFLSIPLIKDVLLSWQTLNFSFAMETLTSGGITIENAINESKVVTTNEAYKQALDFVVNDIQKGLSLSQAFSAYSVFPSYLSKWIMVGEKSGKTEQVFSHIRSYYQGEIDRLSSRFMALVEPVLIILVGLILLILVINVVVPIFSLYGSIL